MVSQLYLFWGNYRGVKSAELKGTIILRSLSSSHILWVCGLQQWQWFPASQQGSYSFRSEWSLRPCAALHTLLLSVEDAEKQGLSMVTIWSNNNDNKKNLYHLRHFFSRIFINNNNNNKDREETSNV